MRAEKVKIMAKGKKLADRIAEIVDKSKKPVWTSDFLEMIPEYDDIEIIGMLDQMVKAGVLKIEH